MADLEEAFRQAIDATPDDHPNRAMYLNNLGAYLGNRYFRTGAMADLEEAIQVGRRAVDATPENQLDRAGRLSNLGAFLSKRYSRTSAMADLEESIQVARQAVEATPDNHPDRVARLSNLGAFLGERYSHAGVMADLEETVEGSLRLKPRPLSPKLGGRRRDKQGLDITQKFIGVSVCAITRNGAFDDCVPGLGLPPNNPSAAKPPKSPNSSPNERTEQLPKWAHLHTVSMIMVMILNYPEIVPDINFVL
ncbi:hypothetical protein TSTA_080430 [Talaromyces stipitatus ATCC 10500]|uniref:Uncharacterized protein n=1 Tax=Talaromyces stipitatus (strain ATCC 10500 / CBS 375.48 / QM 6759 / NRRL 1006) TaxID=441959 RepID=B8MVK8_TALSN|nr:uncharacterized protein TSTA_080430 [Talaromyces stipitatus ATCC 10500]EED11432.1 hypothetical protein TSTA_080430 [Talaromyces stipitatus ATCC 10500]